MNAALGLALAATSLGCQDRPQSRPAIPQVAPAAPASGASRWQAPLETDDRPVLTRPTPGSTIRGVAPTVSGGSAIDPLDEYAEPPPEIGEEELLAINDAMAEEFPGSHCNQAYRAQGARRTEFAHQTGGRAPHRPDRNVFMALCRRQPVRRQKCMVPSYVQANAEECGYRPDRRSGSERARRNRQ